MDQAAARASDIAVLAFEDGLGRRYRVQTGGDRDVHLEVLCFRPELTDIPSFEFALRERVTRLSTFQHAYYARIRRVDRLNGGTLALFSECTPGVRLSELLAETERRGLALDINTALCVLRQLAPAVALLHQTAHTANGALSSERLILTPQARLVIVEFAVGSALEQLHYSRERYWQDLRVALPPSAGLPRFDEYADVAQLGMVGLSLILGRPIRNDEYPGSIDDLVASATALSEYGAREPITASLRSWLRRALQLDVRNSFRSPAEAQTALEEMLASDETYSADLNALTAFLSRYEAPTTAVIPEMPRTTEPRFEMPTYVESVVPEPRVADHTPPVYVEPVERARVEPAHSEPAHVEPAHFVPAHIEPVRIEALHTEPVHVEPARVDPPASLFHAPETSVDIQQSLIAAEIRHAAETKIETPAASVKLTPHEAIEWVPQSATVAEPIVTPESDATHEAPQSAGPAINRTWIIGAAVAAVVVAGLFFGRGYFLPAAAAVSTGTLSINTNPPGAQIVVDDVPRGQTPLNLSLPAGAHKVTIKGDGEPRSIPVTIVAGATSSQYLDLPKAAVTTGMLQIWTDPSGARVTVDGQSRGTTPLTVTELASGEHSVTLENDFGSVNHKVVVVPGVPATLVVPLNAPQGAVASGWMSVTAPVEMQIFEQGRLLGTSGIDRIMLPAGKHEIELANETLGFRTTKTVQVTTGRVSPVSVVMPKGVVSLNALPWATVTIDGESVGETPIGNLSVSIGPHEVTFINPQFPEQRRVINVTLNTPLRLSIDLSKK